MKNLEYEIQYWSSDDKEIHHLELWQLIEILGHWGLKDLDRWRRQDLPNWWIELSMWNEGIDGEKYRQINIVFTDNIFNCLPLWVRLVK